MPGKRAVEGGTNLTDRAAYRSNLSSVDASIESATIPELDTRESPHYSVGLGQADKNQYGHNAQIDFAFLADGFSSVTVELWLKASLEARYVHASGAVPPAPVSLPATGEWVFVAEKTITRSSLWIVQDIPPGVYKVRVSAVSGVGVVHIRESHAA